MVLHTRAASEPTSPSPSHHAPLDPSWWHIDYATLLTTLDPSAALAQQTQLLSDRSALEKEAHFLLSLKARKEYEYCYTPGIPVSERQQRIKECTLYEMAYVNVHTAMSNIDIQLVKLRTTLCHKSLWNGNAELPIPSLDAWLPQPALVQLDTHDPDLSIRELIDIHSLVVREITRLKTKVADETYPVALREAWKSDVESARALERAAENVCQELEGMQMARGRKDSAGGM